MASITAAKYRLYEAIESAQRADTLVYRSFRREETGRQALRRTAVWAAAIAEAAVVPAEAGGRTHDGKSIFQQISRETGGGFFEVSKKLPIDQIYDRIEEELRNQYSLGLSRRTKSTRGTGFRRIAVTVKAKGMIVQTRQGIILKHGRTQN